MANRKAGLVVHGDIAGGGGLAGGVDHVHGGGGAVTGATWRPSGWSAGPRAGIAQAQAVGAQEAHAVPDADFVGELATGLFVQLDVLPVGASRGADVVDHAGGRDADDGLRRLSPGGSPRRESRSLPGGHAQFPPGRGRRGRRPPGWRGWWRRRRRPCWPRRVRRHSWPKCPSNRPGSDRSCCAPGRAYRPY